MSTINKKYKNVIPELYKNSELIEFSKKIEKLTKRKDYEVLYRKKNSKKFLPINKVFFSEEGVDFCYVYNDEVVDDSGDLFYFKNDKIIEVEDDSFVTMKQIINRFKVNDRPIYEEDIGLYTNYNLKMLGI